MLALFTALEIAIVVGAPLALAAWLVRRFPPLSWSTFGAGAACFVGAQVLHIPFNALVLEPAIARASLPVIALALGISSGVFEEVARFVVLRFLRRRDDTGPHALMFGAGHGGVESMFVGVLGLFSLFNLALIAKVGIENLTPDAAAQEAVRTAIAQGEAAPWQALVPALERLLSIPFHVAATCLVLLAVRGRPLYLLLAIAWHAIGNTGVVWIGGTFGLAAVQLWLAIVLPVHVAIIVYALRALPRLAPPTPNPRPETAGAPLELHGATKTFATRKDTVVALDDVTFTLRRGERACLLGPNGAGKTTAIRLFTGALAPTRGWALVFGTASRDRDFLAAKRRVGIVPQQPGMYDAMSVRQYLDLVRALYEAPPYEAVAERLGLTELLDRETKVLSGGQQRRLCLAAALMSEPELLILDEPSAGLDPIASREMIACLEEASRERTTLLCTHDLDEAERLCESVIMLRRGKVIVHAQIADLRREAPTRLALRAAKGADRLRDALEQRGHEVALEEDGEITILFLDAERRAPELLRDLLSDGVDVFECRVLRPTLEELFLHYMAREEASA